MADFSEIEEMYLKTMFEIHSENPAAIVKTTQLADIKGVSAASNSCRARVSASTPGDRCRTTAEIRSRRRSSAFLRRRTGP